MKSNKFGLLSILLAIGLAVVAVLAVILVVPTRADEQVIIGPVSTPPGGVTIIPNDPSGAQIGLAGGLQNEYRDFDPSQYQALYWGAAQSDAVAFAFDGFIHSGEQLTFSLADSDLPNGIARWTGNSLFAYWTGSMWNQPLLPTRFTLQVTDLFGNPIPMLLASDLGLIGDGAVISVTASFRATLLMETNYGSWTPALALFNAYNTPQEWGGRVLSSFDGEFYYTDQPITNLSATNDSPTVEGHPTTLTATVVSGTNVNYAWDFGDNTLGSGRVVTHIYPATGIYTAVITASNSATAISTTTTIEITESPIIGLGAVNDSPSRYGQPTTLTAAIASGSNVAYTWDFGDGAFGAGNVVTHTYPASGFYTAVVTATNSISQLTATTVVTSLYEVIGLDPLPNTILAPAGSPVVATFNGDVDTSSISPATFRVDGNYSGKRTGAYGFPSGDQASFDPAQDFWPGELVLGVATSGMLSGDGLALLPRVWQFRTAVGGGSGHFVDSGQNLASPPGYSGTLGDLDGDGDLDAFVAGYVPGGQPNYVWLNDGHGVFVDSGQRLGNAESLDVALGDLDGDGDLDAFVATYNFQPDMIWINNGSGVFTDSGQRLGSQSGEAVALGDLDGDGDLDAFVGNYGNQPNQIWLNDGAGVFSDNGQSLELMYTIGVALGDVDGDGDLDAYSAACHTTTDKLWINDGTAHFTDSGQTLDGMCSHAAELADLDGDHDLDVFVVNGAAEGQPNVVWMNDGSGVFTNSGQPLGNAQSSSVTVGDLDADGDLDAFVTNIESPTLYWPNEIWLNDGSGIFTDSGQQIPSTLPRDVALGDVDGDGDLDAFLVNENQPHKIWLNEDRAELSLVKTVASPIVERGQPVYFTLTYQNDGPQTATEIMLTDQLPVTLTQVSYVSSGAVITATGGIPYSWQVAPLLPGQGGMITITGLINPIVPLGTIVVNTASITTTAATRDTHSEDDSDWAEVMLVNARPAAVDDVAGTDEDTVEWIAALGNDHDADGDILAILSVGNPLYGSAVLDGDSILYTPVNATITYVDIFTYTISDGVLTDTAVVTVDVSADNDDPLAVPDTANTDEDTPETIAVLLNDSDPEGLALTLESVGVPNVGTVTIQGSSLVYTPVNRTSDYSAVFTYTVSDGVQNSSAMVTVAVTANNDAPAAVADTAATDEDTAVTVDVLANDTDPEGMTLSLVSAGQPVYGVVTMIGSSLRYTPVNRTANYTAVFTYTLSDGVNNLTAGVTVSVIADNDPPLNTVPEAFSLLPGASKTGLAFGVADIDAGDTFSFTLATAHGTLTLATTQGLTLISGANSTSSMTLQGSLEAINAALSAVTYHANPGYVGADTITLISDDNDVADAQTDTDVVGVMISAHRLFLPLAKK